MSGLTPRSKTCSDCGFDKPAAEFRRNAARPDGLGFYCRACTSRREKASYRKRRERIGKMVREPIDVPAGCKWCPGCRTVRPFEEWGRNKRSRDGYNSYCKECRNARSARDYLKRTHRLTPEDVERMTRCQGGVCMICLRASAEHVDHDHATGERRGVLCFNCNVALGQFRDDPWVLRRAIEYLTGGLLGLRLRDDGTLEVTEVRRAAEPVRVGWHDEDFVLLGARARAREDSGDPWEVDVEIAEPGPTELRFPALDLSELSDDAPRPPEYALS